MFNLSEYTAPKKENENAGKEETFSMAKDTISLCADIENILDSFEILINGAAILRAKYPEKEKTADKLWIKLLDFRFNMYKKYSTLSAMFYNLAKRNKIEDDIVEITLQNAKSEMEKYFERLREDYE